MRRLFSRELGKLDDGATVPCAGIGAAFPFDDPVFDVSQGSDCGRKRSRDDGVEKFRRPAHVADARIADKVVANVAHVRLFGF